LTKNSYFCNILDEDFYKVRCITMLAIYENNPLLCKQLSYPPNFIGSDARDAVDCLEGFVDKTTNLGGVAKTKFYYDLVKEYFPEVELGN